MKNRIEIFTFFIDEFQDTSKLQWNNIKPLIENSLPLKIQCIVSGDLNNQYRWRG